jgi:transcriptional regulator with XRE-family HTH domain
MMITDKVLLAFGEELKSIRQEKGWTLDELSKKSGVSISAISKIENGNANPSFEILLKIARSVQMNFVELMDGGRPTASTMTRRVVTRIGQCQTFSTPYYDYDVHTSELTQKAMVPLQMRIKTRTLPPLDQWSIHEGEEFIYVLKGVLEFHTEIYAPVLLRPGESCYVDSTMRHAFVSVSEEDAEILSICLSIKSFETVPGSQ